MKSTCGACGRIFSSISSFDKHRVGRFEPMERRCLTEPEMLQRGMTKNEKGWWTTGEFDASKFRKAV
jgi:hypothetical protein